MKGIIDKIMIGALLMMMGAMAWSCSDDDTWDEMPTPIAKFVSQYFPGEGVSEYKSTDKGYHVKLSNGPGLTFDKNYKWLVINGYGERLPQVLLFDQLPPAMYEYIQGNGLIDNAMSMERTERQYTLVLLDTTVYYDIATAKVTEG